MDNYDNEELKNESEDINYEEIL